VDGPVGLGSLVSESLRDFSSERISPWGPALDLPFASDPRIPSEGPFDKSRPASGTKGYLGTFLARASTGS
jgi:hypothetical protein